MIYTAGRIVFSFYAVMACLLLTQAVPSYAGELRTGNAPSMGSKKAASPAHETITSPTSATTTDTYDSGYNSPDVEINRSVLQELKGYTPPSMFSASPTSTSTENSESLTTPQEDKPALQAPAVTTPIAEQPTLTAPTLNPPKSEDLLEHPAENFHVLTEKKGSSDISKKSELPLPTPKTTAKKPVADAKKASSPTASKKQERLTVLPLPTAADKARAKAQNIKKSDKKEATPKDVVPPETSTKKAERKIFTDDNFVMPKVEPKPYKLKAPKTMPAVPPVGVERSALPPTVLPLAEAPKATPTIGDKIIDQSLSDKMIDDTTKIVAVLGVNKSAPELLSFEFKESITDLSKDQLEQLNTSILPALTSNTSLRVEIRAFATAVKGDESNARRVSLSRALALRQYFIDHGIPPARMDLRALGNQTDQTPLDRVDLVTK